MTDYKLVIGKEKDGKEIHLKYTPFDTKPLLIHGISGSGKSNLVEGIEIQIENIPEIDRPNIVACTPEEEFARFRKHNKNFIIIGEGGELPMIKGQGFKLGQIVRMERLDVILNIATFDTEEENDEYYADFLTGMFKVPSKYWKPTCFIGDEIQTSCSSKKITKSRQPILNLVQRGRKRGFLSLFCTQGLKDFYKDARDQCTNEIIGFTKDIDNREIACELLGMPKSDSHLFYDLAELNDREQSRFFYASGTEISFRNILFESKDLGNKTKDDKYGIPAPSPHVLKIAENIRKQLGVAELSPEGQLQSEVSRLSIENGILKMNEMTDDNKQFYMRSGYLKGWQEKDSEEKLVIQDLVEKFNKHRLPIGKLKVVYIETKITPRGAEYQVV